MSGIEEVCGAKVARCGSVPFATSSETASSVAHNKDIAHNLILWDDTIIPIRRRYRNFYIGMRETRVYADLKLTRYWDSDAAAIGYSTCYNHAGTDNAVVNEYAVFTDTKLFILDPDNKHAFWCEYEDTVAFSTSGNKLAKFKMMFGDGYFHKLKIDLVAVHRVAKWHLMINGVDEVVNTETESFTLYNTEHPLILCWPIPPSTAIPLDEDILKYGFYDYNAGGPGAALEMAYREGGKDFYYPLWLQFMGQDKTVDEDDAADRFLIYFWNFYPDPLTRVCVCPDLPYGEVRGNIEQDINGNILVSVDAGGMYINRLYSGKTGGRLQLPSDIMPGEDLRLYAIGVG